jgi:hypothetical protein
MVFTVFRLLTDFVCLYTYEFWLSLCSIVRSSVILLLPLLNYYLIEIYNIQPTQIQKLNLMTQFVSFFIFFKDCQNCLDSRSNIINFVNERGEKLMFRNIFSTYYFMFRSSKMTNKQKKEKKLTFLNHLLAPTFLAQNPKNKK